MSVAYNDKILNVYMVAHHYAYVGKIVDNVNDSLFGTSPPCPPGSNATKAARPSHMIYSTTAYTGKPQRMATSYLKAKRDLHVL